MSLSIRSAFTPRGPKFKYNGWIVRMFKRWKKPTDSFAAAYTHSTVLPFIIQSGADPIFHHMSISHCVVTTRHELVIGWIPECFRRRGNPKPQPCRAAHIDSFVLYIWFQAKEPALSAEDLHSILDSRPAKVDDIQIAESKHIHMIADQKYI